MQRTKTSRYGISVAVLESVGSLAVAVHIVVAVQRLCLNVDLS